MGYTKGKWEERLVMGEREICVAPNESNIITEVICRNVRHWNAPIIKAAPDMYEALDELVMAFSNHQLIADGVKERVLNKARKALAKVEGD